MAECLWIEEEDDSTLPVVIPPSQGSSRNRHPQQFRSQTFTRRNAGRGNEANWRTRGYQGNSQPQGQRSQTNANRHQRNITVPSSKVGRIIGKGGCKIKDIEYESSAKVHIGNENGGETNVTITGDETAINIAADMINDLVKDYKPKQKVQEQASSQIQEQASAQIEEQASAQIEEPMPNFIIINENGDEAIDWARLNAFNDEIQRERWSLLSPLIKDFYKEDPSISSMTIGEVVKWRRDNHYITVKRTFDNLGPVKRIPNPVLTFEQAFKDYPDILNEIYKQNFTKPSPIQSQAWPVLLSGDDLIGIAQTGTGKTLAFLLPALIHIDGQPIPREDREGPTVLILAPTRELALQIQKEVSKYQYKGIKSVCLYGGGDRKEQIKTVAKGVDIVIATPGRLNDLVKARHLNITNFSYIVLDEADRMLDMGFEPQIKKSLFDLRPDRQTVMTSATWPSGVRRLAETYMADPVQINVGSLDLAAVHTVEQKIMFVEENDKEKELYEFLKNMAPTEKAIVFCGKKATTIDVYTNLCLKGFQCQALHGDRDQSDREAALADMVAGTVNILVATDVASRGIDIKDLTYVINFDFPRHIEEYVHRVGRTGRAGKTGTSITFMTTRDWVHSTELVKILVEAQQEVPQELQFMAIKFEAMKLRRFHDGRSHGYNRGGGRGNRGRQW